MRKTLRNNGLSIVCGLFFIAFLVGQAITGQLQHNEDQRQHGQPEVGFVEYLEPATFSK